MAKKIINFGNTEVEKHKFHQSKSPIPIDNVDVNKLIISNKVSIGKKDFDKMSFLIKDDELLEKYNEIRTKDRTASKKNLIVNLHTMKNI